MGNHFWVMDLLGLADPVTARLRIPTYTTRLPPPGHEKMLPKPWIAARLVPEGVVVQPRDLPGDSLIHLTPVTSGTQFQEQVDAARTALECAPLRRLDRDVTAPMTPARFLGNIVDSFANTFLRISPDPEQAKAELCGGGRSEGSAAPRSVVTPLALTGSPMGWAPRPAAGSSVRLSGPSTPSPRWAQPLTSLSGFI